MNKISTYFLIIGIASLTSVAEAQSSLSPLDNPDSFRKKLEQMSTQTNAIRAQFKQEKYMDILSNTIQSEGEILFRKPNLLKWAYHQPFQYTIVLDGKEIKVKDEEKTNTFNITSSKVFKQVNDLIVSSVNGKILQEDKFDIDYFQDAKNFVAFMEPREEQMKKFVSKIELFFDKNDFTVNKIILREPNADYTLIQFLNKKINSSISDEEFNIN